MRRRGSSAALAALLALLLTATASLLGACSAGDDGTGPAPGPSAPGPGDPLIVASGRDVTGKGGIRERLIEQWNARPGVAYRARLVELPGSADEQRSQLLGGLQSGGARYDVVNLDVTWVPEFAEAGLVQSLDPAFLDGDVIDSVARTARWNDAVYSVPFNTDVGLLYYRRDHLTRAGVRDTRLGSGTTWTELRGLIRTVEHRRPPGQEAGWTTQLAPYEGLTVNGIEAFASVMAKGQGLTDERGRYTGTPGVLEDGLDELRVRTDASDLLSEATGSDETASLTAFADGRTTFLRHWPYAYRILHQSLNAQQLGVAPLPGRAVLGGQNLAVTTAATGPRAAAARELIAFLTDRRSERCLLDAGFAATRTSAYSDERVTCRLPSHGASPTTTGAPGGGAPESADRMPRDANGRPRYARTILLPALNGSVVERPRTPHYGAFSQTFLSGLSRLFEDDPPSDKELARDLDAALRRVLPVAR